MVEWLRCFIGVMIEVVCFVMMYGGCVVNFVGGMYYVFCDVGEGYCVFNDVVCVVKSV